MCVLAKLVQYRYVISCKSRRLNSLQSKTATTEIARLLDIPHDTQAVSIDRLTVLSYDPNAYYNDNTDIIPIPDILPTTDALTPLQLKKYPF